jgi:competence protein ComEC
VARSIRYVSLDAIARAVPQPEAGYLAGILVGDKSMLDPALADSFSRTGTSHIMAISGYNITIIAGVLMMMLARLGRTRAYWLTVAGIVLFTIMTGAGASVVRAAIMGILAITALRLGRQSGAGTAILFSAALMASYNPFFVRWDIGFQLSFLALMGIVWVEPLIRPPFEKVFRSKALATLVATTLSANIMVMPLILYDFGQLAMYALPVNVLVLPFVPLAMALGALTAAAGAVTPFAGALVGQIAWLVTTPQLAVIRWFAALPYASLEVHLSIAALTASYTGIAVWIILSHNKKKEVASERSQAIRSIV